MRIRMFGGTPLPEWTRDARFWEWARSPVKGHDRSLGISFPEVSNDKAEEIFRGLEVLHEKTKVGQGAVIAWDLDLPDAVCFGWAGFRVWMGQKPRGELAIEVHWWSALSASWVVTEPSEASVILQALSMVARNMVSKTDKGAFRQRLIVGDYLKISLVHPPWEIERMHLVGGIGLLLEENEKLEDVQHIQRWGDDFQIHSVCRWLNQCMRRAARRWPGFHLLGIAIHDKRDTQMRTWVNSTLATLNADPSWINHPWLWMSVTSEEIQALGPVTVAKAQALSCEALNLDNLPYLMDMETAHLNMMGVGWLDERTRQWARGQRISHAWRFAKQVATQQNEKRLRFPVALVVNLLAEGDKSMPNSARLWTLLSSPPVFIRWLASFTPWRKGKGAWHVPNYRIVDLPEDNPEMKCLVAARALLEWGEEAFEAVGRTAQLLAEAPTVRMGKQAWVTAEHDLAVSEQLVNRSLWTWMDWPALAAAQDWQQVHDVVVDAERRAMQPLLDGERNIEDTEFANSLVSTQTKLGIFHTTRLIHALSVQPELIEWRDREGYSLLDWVHEHAQGRPLEENELMWLAQHAPGLLINATAKGTTLERLDMNNEVRATIRRQLLGRVVEQREEAPEGMTRM